MVIISLLFIFVVILLVVLGKVRSNLSAGFIELASSIAELGFALIILVVLAVMLLVTMFRS